MRSGLQLHLMSSIDESTKPQVKEITIPDGTELSVVLTETISSKTVGIGDPVNFKVYEDVVINGMVVIERETLVKGSVTSAERRGRIGNPGKLSIRIETTRTVDNQVIKLRASKGKVGEAKTRSIVALTFIVGPFSLLKHGGDAEIKENTRIIVMTDEEKTVQTNLVERAPLRSNVESEGMSDSTLGWLVIAGVVFVLLIVGKLGHC